MKIVTPGHSRSLFEKFEPESCFCNHCYTRFEASKYDLRVHHNAYFITFAVYCPVCKYPVELHIKAGSPHEREILFKDIRKHNSFLGRLYRKLFK